MNRKPSKAAASGQSEALATAQADRLITAADVMALLGLKCRTAHTALNLARRGKIKAVKINERVIRYSEASVRALVAGRVNA